MAWRTYFPINKLSKMKSDLKNNINSKKEFKTLNQSIALPSSLTVNTSAILTDILGFSVLSMSLSIPDVSYIDEAKSEYDSFFNKKICTDAYRRPKLGDVVMGDLYFNYEQSVLWISMGNDLFCDTQEYALEVAVFFGRPPKWHWHNEGKRGYYPHYHPENSHSHIWYLP